jgi:hypothetical protein
MRPWTLEFSYRINCIPELLATFHDYSRLTLTTFTLQCAAAVIYDASAASEAGVLEDCGLEIARGARLSSSRRPRPQARSPAGRRRGPTTSPNAPAPEVRSDI